MRLWTLHPKHLDPRGLVALWREGLLAQAVLAGMTRGYRHHPQLIRFRAATDPLEAIGAYLQVVWRESEKRGYRFQRGKIARAGTPILITTTRGQLEYEWWHLGKKLERRAPDWLAGKLNPSEPSPHPLFRVVPGPVERWEVEAVGGR